VGARRRASLSKSLRSRLARIGSAIIWPDFGLRIEVVAYWKSIGVLCSLVGLKKCGGLRRRPRQKPGLLYLKARRGTQVAQGRGLQNLHSWVRIPPAPPLFPRHFDTFLENWAKIGLYRNRDFYFSERIIQRGLSAAVPRSVVLLSDADGAVRQLVVVHPFEDLGGLPNEWLRLLLLQTQHQFL
jgi:hypothetical protein